jgi:hypothetical protein
LLASQLTPATVSKPTSKFGASTNKGMVQNHISYECWTNWR